MVWLSVQTDGNRVSLQVWYTEGDHVDVPSEFLRRVFMVAALHLDRILS